MAPIRSLGEQHEEIRRAIERVLESGMWVYGPEGKAFEEELARYIGADRVVGVSSGTDALLLALQALKVKPGDEIITPAYSFFASASVIAHHGAKPVFVDVDDRTFNIAPKAIEAAVTSKTVGIVAVHLYGLPADMKAIRAVAEAHGLFVLEDACQAIGAKIGGKMVGIFGDLSAFSFYPTKNLAACGEGGAVSGIRADALEAVSRLRVHGETERYHHDLLGRNCRPQEIQSAILRIRLGKLGEWTKRRQEIAGIYTGAWADLPLRVPYVPDGFEHVYHLYVIQSRDREKLRKFLSERNIGSGLYYPVTLPNLEIFSDLEHKPGEFPVSERLCREVLAIPVFPQLTDSEVERVTNAVLEFCGY